MTYEEYKKFLEKNTGKDGLIKQLDGDQGDTCQREGLFIALLALSGENYLANERLQYALSKLQVEPGVYRRASDPDKWYSNPNNLSRDQRAMLELAMAACGDKKTLKEAMLYILSRGGFHQNVHPGTDVPEDMRKTPDIVSPGELGVYIRGLNLKFLYPILMLLDIGLIADIYLRSKWDGANMTVINIMYANHKYPTIFSKLAAKLMPIQDMKEEITTYYSAKKNGIPDLGELYVKCINKFFKL